MWILPLQRLGPEGRKETWRYGSSSNRKVILARSETAGWGRALQRPSLLPRQVQPVTVMITTGALALSPDQCQGLGHPLARARHSHSVASCHWLDRLFFWHQHIKFWQTQKSAWPGPGDTPQLGMRQVSHIMLVDMLSLLLQVSSRYGQLCVFLVKIPDNLGRSDVISGSLSVLALLSGS